MTSNLKEIVERETTTIKEDICLWKKRAKDKGYSRCLNCSGYQRECHNYSPKYSRR